MSRPQARDAPRRAWWLRLALAWAPLVLVEALPGARLPAWIAVPGAFAGLDALALILLGATGLALFWLYHISRRLG